MYFILFPAFFCQTKAHHFGWRIVLLNLVGIMIWCSHSFALPMTDAQTTLQEVAFQRQNFIVRAVDPKKEDLRMYLNDDGDNTLRNFVALSKYTESKGERLVFAANAGMFNPANRPVGLFVQDGKEITRLNLNDGAGNFYMKPNGVFLINKKHEAHVIESSEYPAQLSPAVWATQSGPLLVRGGNINPDFYANSKNLAVRSGVGVREDGTIFFGISRLQVNFYTFASFFLTQLKCPNALYLDGTISSFYAPDRTNKVPYDFGPMVGVVAKEK